jgi:cytochrome P450
MNSLIRLACWLFMLLGSHPEWRAMAKAEVEGLLAAAGYTFISETAETSTPFNSPSDTFPDSVHSSSSTLESLSHVLSSIPLTTWESSTPVLTAIVTETLRLAQPHTAMRKNLGPETFIDGVRVPSGAYVVYPFADVHLDPDVYDEPGRWNPGRWLEDIDNSREKEKGDKGKFGYIGWGAGQSFRSFVNVKRMTEYIFVLGKTTCLGTRLAKVELKLVLAMLLVGFEHWTVPAPNSVYARMHRNSKAQTAGPDSPPLKQRKTSLTPVPVPDFNDALHCKPSNGPFNVRYQRTGVPL